MSVPAPPTALANQVTAIHANTLFAFQPNAFQSISLAQGSKWDSLSAGTPVNGSQAVATNDGLYIVGGRSEGSYPGLQKYHYDSKSWETVTPGGGPSVVQNRVQHGAVWLQESNTMLVYGGSQDNSYRPTADTYSISLAAPYNMNSHGPGAPSVQNPILLPLNSTHAIMAGGGANQDQVWVFSEAGGWVMMTTTVPGGIADASKVQGALTTDSSGNKQLSLFDMSQSPNKVTTVSLSNQFHRRGVPAIAERDDINAPTASRNGFSLAQADDTVVISGGTSDQSAGSLAVFKSGKFQDPSSVFGAQQQQQSQAQGSTPANALVATGESSASAASSGAPASSAAPASSGSPSSNAQASSSAPASSAQTSASASQSASQGASSSASAAASATSGSSSAASSGATSATNSAGATATGTAASAGGANASKTAGGASSTAAGAAAAAAQSAAAAGGAGSDSTTIILAAVLGSFFGIAAIFLLALLLVRYRRNKAKEEQLRQEALDEKRAESPASTIGSINNGRNKSPFENGQTPQISRPTLDPQIEAEDLAPPRKLNQDDEWGRYFNNNNTVENLYPGTHGEPHAPGAGVAGAAVAGAAVGAAAGVGLAAAARNTTYTVGSEYTIDSPTSSGPRDSAAVPPLHLRSSSQAQFDSIRPISDVSSNNRASFPNYSSVDQSWGEPSSSFGSNRPASSIYPADRASSVYPANPLSPNTMGNFPPVPQRPGFNDKGMRSIISTDFGNGSPVAQNGGMTFSESAARRLSPGAEPRSAGSGTGHSEKDLSWLQIGGAK